jgi:hypothetical protein
MNQQITTSKLNNKQLFNLLERDLLFISEVNFFENMTLELSSLQKNLDSLKTNRKVDEQMLDMFYRILLLSSQDDVLENYNIQLEKYLLNHLPPYVRSSCFSLTCQLKRLTNSIGNKNYHACINFSLASYLLESVYKEKTISDFIDHNNKEANQKYLLLAPDVKSKMKQIVDFTLFLLGENRKPTFTFAPSKIKEETFFRHVYFKKLFEPNQNGQSILNQKDLKNGKLSFSHHGRIMNLNSSKKSCLQNPSLYYTAYQSIFDNYYRQTSTTT